jgi:hypothetical protein
MKKNGAYLIGKITEVAESSVANPLLTAGIPIIGVSQ